MRAYWLAIALWVLVGVLFIGVLIPSPIYINAHKEATKYAQQHCDSHDTFAWAVDALFSTAFWTAAATLAIASFTYMLKLSTDRLAKATDETIRLTQQSIDLASDEFISTQRPRIIIRQIAIWHPTGFDNFMNGEPFQFIADEKIHGRVFIANIGATRATVDFFCNIFYWKEPSFPMLYPYDMLEIRRQEPPIILERGQRMTLHGLAGGPLSKSVIDNIGIGETKLFVMGWVQYRDDRTVIRETRFCRLWNNSERRFTVVNNPDYEYSD